MTENSVDDVFAGAGPNRALDCVGSRASGVKEIACSNSRRESVHLGDVRDFEERGRRGGDRSGGHGKGGARKDVISRWKLMAETEVAGDYADVGFGMRFSRGWCRWGKTFG